MDYNKKYNISFKGLNKGDFIEYSEYSIYSNFTKKCLILKRKLKSKIKTKHGVSKYFDYTVLQDNEVIKIKTQNIKIHSIMRAK